jgi:hypothetical protein
MYLLGEIPQLTHGVFSFLNISNIPFTLHGMDVQRIVSLLVIAVLMTVFEILFLLYVAKFEDRKKLIITAMLANVTALILGIGTLNAIYPRFIQPRLF